MARGSGQNSSGRSRDTDSPPSDREDRVRNILRNIYDDVLAEPIPESFADLLRKLE